MADFSSSRMLPVGTMLDGRYPIDKYIFLMFLFIFASCVKTNKDVDNDSLQNGITNKTFTVNGVSFTMVAVEGGTFTMGFTSDQGVKEVWESNDESPHKVTLNDYRIGETEVTQALWMAVMGCNPSEYKGDSLPVETVSWDDCQSFINKLNSMTAEQRPEGKYFRLPTEEEWEFAARGGNKSNHTKYAGGNDLDSVAWYGKDRDLIVGTHPVAQKSPNELGLYDMSGNVAEWCQDWCGKNVSCESLSDGSCYKVKPPGRVYRGGCWLLPANYCRVSHHDYTPPDDAYSCIGLRLAL